MQEGGSTAGAQDPLTAVHGPLSLPEVDQGLCGLKSYGGFRSRQLEALFAVGVQRSLWPSLPGPAKPWLPTFPTEQRGQAASASVQFGKDQCSLATQAEEASARRLLAAEASARQGSALPQPTEFEPKSSGHASILVQLAGAEASGALTVEEQEVDFWCMATTPTLVPRSSGQGWPPGRGKPVAASCYSLSLAGQLAVGRRASRRAPAVKAGKGGK